MAPCGYLTQGLTQLTGSAHPALGTVAQPVGSVTRGSVLAQATLATVRPVEARRALWENEKPAHQNEE